MFCFRKTQEHLNVFLVVFKYMNTLRTLQIILKIILSAFQIVKELITSNEVTIFKSTLLSISKKVRLKMVELSRIELLTSCVQGRRSPS